MFLWFVFATLEVKVRLYCPDFQHKEDFAGETCASDLITVPLSPVWRSEKNSLSSALTPAAPYLTHSFLLLSGILEDLLVFAHIWTICRAAVSFVELKQAADVSLSKRTRDKWTQNANVCQSTHEHTQPFVCWKRTAMQIHPIFSLVWRATVHKSKTESLVFILLLHDYRLAKVSGKLQALPLHRNGWENIYHGTGQ